MLVCDVGILKIDNSFLHSLRYKIYKQGLFSICKFFYFTVGEVLFSDAEAGEDVVEEFFVVGLTCGLT